MITKHFLITILSIATCFITACSEPVKRLPPTISGVYAPTNLSITKGSEGSIFFDLKGENAKTFSLSILSLSPENDDATQNIQLSLAQPSDVLYCGDRASYSVFLFCYEDGLDENFDLKQLEVKFAVPENHPVGIWDVSVKVSVSNGLNSNTNGLSNQIIGLITLTVTDAVQ